MATRQSQVVITANGKQAEAVLTAITERVKTLSASEKQLKEALKQMRLESKQDTDQYKQLQQQLKGVQREMKSLNTAAQQNVSNMEKVNAVVNNLAKSSTRQLRDALRAGKKELERMSASDKELKPLQQRLQQIQQQIDRNTGAVKNHGSAWQIAVKNITAYVGVFGAFNILKQKLQDITQLSLKFSDQLADVRKVSGLEIEDINKLAENLSKIDTRTSLSTMVGNLAYSGAKLGFGNMGIEGLESYVKAANQVNVALGEELGEQAMPALSKITENMGLIKKMGVEKAMLATGSAIFKLASTSTASAGPIVEFSKRLLSVGKNAGLTTDQILALGSASDSMMLMPEVASTALGKLVVAMQTNHNLIEKSLHIEPGTISNLYQSGKMMEAMLLIFQKMHEKGGINALGDIFKDLGSDGQRLKATLVTMSEQLPMLRQHLQTSSEAFREATAVTAEYNIQQDTAAGIMQRANNMWEKAFVNPTSVDMVKEMAKAWYDVSKSLTQSEGYISAMQFALQSLFTVLSGLIRLAPAALIAGVARVLFALATSLGAAKIGTDGLAASWARLSTAMKANWISLVIGLVAQLAIQIYSMTTATDKGTTALSNFDMSLKELEAQAGRADAEMRRLGKAIEEAEMGTNARNAAIATFNQKFGQYLSNLLTENATAKDLAKAYDEVSRAIRAKLALQLKQKDIENEVGTREGWAVDKRQRYGKTVAGTEYSQYTPEWLAGYARDNSRRNMGDIAKDLGKRYNLTPAQIADVMRQGGKDTYQRLVKTGYTGAGPYGGGPARVENRATDGEIAFHAAMRYILQDRSAQNALQRVNRKWKPEQDSMDALLAKEENNKRDPLVNDKPDKDALAAARKAALEEKKEMRQQLQESEAEAKAIVDNIKNFYERQITETLNIATATGMNSELQDQLVNSLTMRMNSALAQARKAVAGTKNEWEEFKKTIQDDMIEPLVDGTNESMQLLDKIENNNLAALRRQIVALSKSLNKPESALIDQVWKNATLNEKANAKIENKEEQRRRQAILEKNFTAKVNQDTENTMEQFGFAMLTPEQMKIILDGGKSAQQFLDERSREWQNMLANARENFAAVAGADSPDSLWGILFGQDWESHRDEMVLRGLLDLAGEDFQLFYDELIKYNDAYVEAQKRAAERVVKINDYVFQNQFSVKAIDNEVRELDKLSKQQGREGGRHRDMRQRMGIADTMAEDPELLRLALIEERERKHLEMMQKLLEQEKITMKEYNTALEQYDNARAAHADKVAQSVSERIALLQQLTHPIEDFGTAVGDAFATMTTDAEEGRQALQDAVKSMIEQFAKMTIKMYAELMTQKVNQALFHQEMEEEDRRHNNAQAVEEESGKKRVSVIKAIGALILGQKKKQKKQELKIEKQAQGEQTDIVEEEGESRLDVTSVVETGIASITQKAAQEVAQTKQSQAAANAATTAAETEGSVAAGVAGGAAKIIGTLGWWGIPLIAVITALLNGLLALALGKLFGGSKSQSSSSSATNVKLKSGMLTYDSGNIHTVLGTDGQIYQARDEGTIQTGIVKSPITATVNGQPSIIGERGPELVVGRETTHAIMLSRPDILRTIAEIDRNRSGRTFRALDNGDLSALGSVSTDSMAANDDTLLQLTQTMAMLSQTLNAIQQRGIPATINKYGRGGLIDEVQSGLKFYGKYQ